MTHTTAQHPEVIALVPPEFLGLARASSREELEREFRAFGASGPATCQAASRAMDETCPNYANTGEDSASGVAHHRADTDQKRHDALPPDSFTLARARVRQEGP